MGWNARTVSACHSVCSALHCARVIAPQPLAACPLRLKQCCLHCTLDVLWAHTGVLNAHLDHQQRQQQQQQQVAGGSRRQQEAAGSSSSGSSSSRRRGGGEQE
jgi:hypothetical protein